MGWLDEFYVRYVKNIPHNTSAFFSNTLQHVGQKAARVPERWNEQRAQYQQFSTARETGTQQIRNLGMFSRSGMTAEQRARERERIASQMPGRFQTYHAHPVLNAMTGVVRAPARVIWSAIRGSARGAQRVAPHITPVSNTWLIIYALIYHFIIFMTDPSIMTRFWLNIAMIILVIILVFDRSERNGDTYRTLFLFVFLLEIFIPYITNRFAILQSIDFVRLYLANSFLILTWFYYAVFARGRDINRGVTRWCRIIIIIFWLGVALSFVGTSMADFSDVELDTAGTEQLFAAKQIYEKAIDGWGTLIDNVTHAVGAVEDTVSIRIKQASGEYYYGVVEQNENEQLGVYLEDLKPSQSLYEEYGSVTVFASLMARTLDDAVNVDVACFAGRETAPTPGKVYPSDSFDVYNLQKEELDCSFERLPVGTNEVTFTADFNFETIGYLKRYFADYDAVVAATRQDVDLLDEYQILDKNPVAHYTNGPVAIGMGPESSLIGISETRTVKPRLALTLDSKWDGQIKEISEVVLIMPKELSLDSSTCTDPDWTAYNVEDCVDSEIEHKTTIYQECEGDEGCVEEVCTAQLENYNAYKLSLAGKPAYKNVEEYITISCRLNVDDVAGLLGATPIATHYFYVKTRYDYQISEDTSVTVEAEEKITMLGEEVKESEDVPSFTSSQKQEALQYIFNKYKDYMFAANKTFGTPVCMQAGIIAQISKGDPNYYDINGERKGLMGITDKMANEAAADAGVGSSYYLYDAETNIMLGNAYLKQIADGTGSNFGDEVIKYYYSGAYLQTDDPTADNEDIIGFVNRVNTYIEECESLGLGEEDILVKEEEVNTEDALVEGLFTYTQSQGELAQYLYTLGGKAVMLRFEPFFTNDDFFDIYFQYGSEDVDNIGVSYIDQFNYWYSFSNYGLFQVFYDVKNTTLKYRYYNDFVKNLYLEEDKPEDVFGDGVLFVEYTGSEVVVSLARDPKDPENLGEICDVGWYEFITYITCEETLTDTDDLSGLIIRNIKTKQSAYSVGVGEEYAYVQLDWSNERQLEGVTS